MFNLNRKIILGSGSPRRKELLKQLGLNFEVMKSVKEELIDKNWTPIETVKNLAMQKAEDIIERVDDASILITADTIVVCENRILGKPRDEEDAYNILRFISGKKQSVITGVVIWDKKYNKIQQFEDETIVYIKDMTDEEIWNYIKTGEPMDKAGAYGLQGLGAVMIDRIEGDFYNVVGLPIRKVYEILRKMSVNKYQ